MGMSAFLIIFALASGQPDMNDVLVTLDQLYRSDDSYSKMQMHIVTEHWERTLEMDAWSSGEERTFIRITSPAREAGSATLRIGDEMWNYLPNTNSTVRIPSSMMTGSWMGSDLTNNDIVKEVTYASDYTGEFIGEPQDAGDPSGEYLYLKLTPKASTAVVWSYIVCAVSTDPVLPVWEKYYDSHGDIIKTVTFSGVEVMGGRTIPTVMRVEPGDNTGRSTTITWSDASFNTGIDQNIFTLANLQSGGQR